MWGQTKELSFDRKIHPTKAGHNPRQSYRPVPTKWLSGKFGLFAIPDEGGKLTSRPIDSAAKTPQQWKQQTELACCKDVINYWVGRFRLDVLDPEDEASMTNQTLICYFSPAC